MKEFSVEEGAYRALQRTFDAYLLIFNAGSGIFRNVYGLNATGMCGIRDSG